jgi:hypothetical protein
LAPDNDGLANFGSGDIFAGYDRWYVLMGLGFFRQSKIDRPSS